MPFADERVSELADDREPAVVCDDTTTAARDDRLPWGTLIRAVTILLLLVSGIGDVVCLAVAVQKRDFDFFLGSVLGGVMLVAVLLLWRFGHRSESQR